MPSALRRYAYAQARIRARVSRLLSRPQIERLADCADAPALEQQLATLGHPEASSTLLDGLHDVEAMLEGPPQEVVRRYGQRYELENVKLLLRAVERGRRAEDVLPLLLPTGALGRPERARFVLSAGSLAEATERLPHPFGEVLRRHARAASPGDLDRAALESIAEREAYEQIWSAAQALDPRDRPGADRVLGVRLDAWNLVRFWRLREAHHLAPEEVLAHAIRGGRYLGAAERQALAHEPPDSWTTQLTGTPFGALVARADSPAHLELLLQQLLARIAERELRGPPFQIGLVLAYVLRLELQANDLRRLVEGRRLGRSRDWILSGLLLPEAA